VTKSATTKPTKATHSEIRRSVNDRVADLKNTHKGVSRGREEVAMLE
jgi:hypothetical protein